MSVRDNTLITSKALAMASVLSTWRRTIHMNPELSFHEYMTSAYIVEVLKRIKGVTIETGVGSPTGVVATIGDGTGPVMALRADIDALPIVEESTQPYTSKNIGVMHACGHDAHTSILLGVAHLLAESYLSGELKGTIRCVFQPAEEATDERGITGAPYMIDAGVYDGVSAAIALHMNPERPVGEVWIHNGYSMANVDNFRGTIRGTGGHAAYPHLTTDSTWMLIPVLQYLHGIIPRFISPLEPAVVSVGKIQGGTTSNVIPTEVIVEGTMRSYDPRVRAELISRVESAFKMAEQCGGEYELEIIRGEPALKNHPVVNELIRQSVKQTYPDCQITDIPFGLGGEDFGHVSHRVPAAMFFLGCGMSDGVTRPLHTPIFDIDERCLSMAVAILVSSVVHAMQYFGA